MLLTTTTSSDTPSPRVRELQTAIARGCYVIDVHAVAAAMLARPELRLAPVRGGAESPSAER